MDSRDSSEVEYKSSLETESRDWTLLYKASVTLKDSIEEILEEFAESYSDFFITENSGPNLAETKVECTLKEQEYSIEQFQVHRKFAQKCEKLIEIFIEKEGSCVTEFYKQCKESLDGKWCALFQEDINQWFVEMCMAVDDFSWFHHSMSKILMRRKFKKRTKK